MFRVNNKDNKVNKINNKVFIVSFEHFTPCSSVFIVRFEQVNAGWVISKSYSSKKNIEKKVVKAWIWIMLFPTSSNICKLINQVPVQPTGNLSLLF